MTTHVESAVTRSIASFILCALVLSAPSNAADTMPYCGTAVMTLEEGRAPSLGWVDAHFNDEAPRGQTLSSPAPGNAPLLRLAGVPGVLGTGTTVGVPGTPGAVRVIDQMRPFGSVPMPALPDTYPGVPGASRSRQVTTLVVDPRNILGTWAPSNDLAGVFVGNSALGEQIALTSMQRWGGPFTGVLVYGDFALRHVPARAGQVAPGGTRSGLVLTSNIDFLDTSVADLANASIASDGCTLTITADLLISGALNVLDPGAIIGTKFGTISITACLARPNVNEDARVDLDDLYAWEQNSGARDIDANGVIDGNDREALIDVLRCRENDDVSAGRR
jgi:hypothetical protein